MKAILLMKTPNGFQLVSEYSISWLYNNYPDIYNQFYERINKTSNEIVLENNIVRCDLCGDHPNDCCCAKNIELW